MLVVVERLTCSSCRRRLVVPSYKACLCPIIAILRVVASSDTSRGQFLVVVHSTRKHLPRPYQNQASPIQYKITVKMQTVMRQGHIHAAAKFFGFFSLVFLPFAVHAVALTELHTQTFANAALPLAFNAWREQVSQRYGPNSNACHDVQGHCICAIMGTGPPHSYCTAATATGT